MNSFPEESLFDNRFLVICLNIDWCRFRFQMLAELDVAAETSLLWPLSLQNVSFGSNLSSLSSFDCLWLAWISYGSSSSLCHAESPTHRPAAFLVSDSHCRRRNYRPVHRLSSERDRSERCSASREIQVNTCTQAYLRASGSLFSLSRLASGATWQSSGQVSHLQNTLIETHFAKYSKQLYERLQNEGHNIGQNTRRRSNIRSRQFLSGYSETGSLWVAQTSDRLHTLKRQYATIKALGINSEIFDVEQLKAKVPIIDPHEIWVGTSLWHTIVIDRIRSCS